VLPLGSFLLNRARFAACPSASFSPPFAARREPDAESYSASSHPSCSSRVRETAPATWTCSARSKAQTRFSAPAAAFADAIPGTSKLARTHSSARMGHRDRMAPVSGIGAPLASSPWLRRLLSLATLAQDVQLLQPAATRRPLRRRAEAPRQNPQPPAREGRRGRGLRRLPQGTREWTAARARSHPTLRERLRQGPGQRRRCRIRPAMSSGT
jgi:hypothetical protein